MADVVIALPVTARPRVSKCLPGKGMLEEAPEPPAYAELHCLTHFSFLRATASPAQLVRRAAALGYAALAITDACSVSGIVQAWQAHRDLIAESADLPESRRPLLHLLYGSSFHFVGQGTLIALARDLEGWGDLCSFVSACRQRAPKGEYVLPPLEAALTALARCERLWLPHRAFRAGTARAREEIFQPVAPAILQARIPLLLELHAAFDDCLWCKYLRAVACANGCLLVAAGGVLMDVRRAKRLHDVLTAIRLGSTVAECGFALQANGERHLRSRTRLAEIYPPDTLAATLQIATRCSFDPGELRYEYPQEVLLPGLTPTQTLAQLTHEGAAWRFPDGVPAPIRTFIDKELALIAECRYEMFFLTVYDIVREARRLGIFCQGRGSAANSVVCYCLGITAADPRYSHPLLERFISKARKNEPPDIDVDFEHERREEIIQYIYRRYGRERAALTGSVITWRTRSALRDVGATLGVDARLVDAVAKAHYGFVGEQGVAQVQEQAQALGVGVSAELIGLWLELAQQLRGHPRHMSQHVGGFVLTQSTLARLVPIEPATMENRQVIQWDKDDLEVLGWLKVDILALGMLTVVHRCLDLVSDWRKHPLTRTDIAPEDPATYAMIRRADTVGVFQIESRAQMSMLPRLRPTTFYDLVVQVAIVRPGPVAGGMVHPYLHARERQRRGLPVIYQRSTQDVPGQPPRLARALERTLGVPIFQEQVMQLSMLAAGFSAADADRLRRAMAAWKKKGGLEPFHARLVAGMLENGYGADFAERLFAQIQGFGDYGFPESHAYSFALIAYESAWLKCHYPAAYLAAMLNSQPMGFYGPSQLVQDARRHGVAVLPPDVSVSIWDCTLESGEHATSSSEQAVAGPAVRLGLCMVHGLARMAAERMVRSRFHAPFADVADLSRRAELDAKTLGQLAAADALAGLAGNRRQQVWQAAAPRRAPELLHEAPVIEPALDLAAAEEGEEIFHDYAALGLTLRRHPLALLRPRLQGLRVHSARQLWRQRGGSVVRVCGLVTGRQRPSTAKGAIFVTLEDETGSINVIAWPSTQVDDEQRAALLCSRLLEVLGVWERDRDSGGRVCHIIARHFRDRTPWLGRLADIATSRDFH